MSRSPSTTITRLRFISPGPAPQAATEAKVGTTFSGRGVKVPSLTKASSFSSMGIGAHADAVGVEHHLAVGIGVFLAEIFQGHQLVVVDRHFSFSPEFFFCGAVLRPLPLWERASSNSLGFTGSRLRGDRTPTFAARFAHLLPQGEKEV
jgi:hypothetical protein